MGYKSLFVVPYFQKTAYMCNINKKRSAPPFCVSSGNTLLFYVLFVVIVVFEVCVGESDRWVVTFKAPSEALASRDCIPPNMTLVKQYGRRAVLKAVAGGPTVVEWGLLEAVFYYKGCNLTATNVEKDSLVESVIVTTSYAYGSMPVQNLWQYSDTEPYSIQMESVWANFSILGDPNITVAVLDSGLAASALVEGLFIHMADGYDFVSDPAISMDGDGRDPNVLEPMDSNGTCPIQFHGTMMATLITGQDERIPGMQPQSTLLPVRVLGLCSTGYANDVADGIVWAAGGNINGLQPNPKPAQVISMSFSGAGPCPSYLQSAIQTAVTQGAILVAAAGNDADRMGAHFPANCMGVVPVGASTRTGEVAAYSNMGPGLLAYAPGGDASNPVLSLTSSTQGEGGDRLSVTAGYGSSFSAALVSGLFALKLSIPALRASLARLFFEGEFIDFPTCAGHCDAGMESGLRLIMGSGKATAGLNLNFSSLDGNASLEHAHDHEAIVKANVFYTMGALGGVCLPGTMALAAGSTVCLQCTAGTFSSGVGQLNCTACYAGTYSTVGGSVWCPLCPAGTYGTATNATVCTLCAAGTYSSSLGLRQSEACTACAAGKYLSAAGSVRACAAPNTTWLFKSPKTGYYYLTLPVQQAAHRYFSPTDAVTYWNKVRINTTLSNSLNTILLYVQAMNATYQVPGTVNSNTGPCYSVGSQYDATYAVVPTDTTTYQDYGSSGSCGWAGGNTRTYLVGTPFGIRDGIKAYTGPGCSWSYTFTFTCNGIQDCSCLVTGNCAGCLFMGVLSVINVTQFQADVNLSCALYPYDPKSLLSCSGTETVNYTCASAPCQVCPAGSYSGADGQSSCALCGAGTFSNVSGGSVCTLCATGSYSTGSGVQSCAPCAAGTYGTGSGLTQSTDCQSCIAGTYSTAWGATGVDGCRACPANSWSGDGAVNCSANSGYYDLGAALMAYYPFNPGQMLLDVSGKLGSLSAPKALPLADCTSDAAGPGGAWTSNCVSAMQANSAAISSSSASAQYLVLPNLILPPSYSVCLWYQPTPYSSSSPNSYEFVFGISQTSGAYGLFAQRISTSNGIGVIVDLGTYGIWLLNWQPGLYFAASTWYHACYTFAGTAFKLYVNGVSVASGTMTSAQDTTVIRDASSIFGCLSGPCFQGKIDEFRLYNTQLSASEVSTVYAFRGDAYTAVLPQPCGIGSYATGSGGTARSVCVACQAGAFQNSTGATVCMLCGAGTYGTGLGFTECALCPSGKYSTSLGLQTSALCLLCNPGTYGTGLGLGTACTLCQGGKYSNASGAIYASTCKGCASGTYARSGFSACRSCPQNSRSGLNASYCTVNAGYYDLGSSLLAYYPFNPNNLTDDVSDRTGTATNVGGITNDPTNGWPNPWSNPDGTCAANFSQPGGTADDSTNVQMQYLSLPSLTLQSSCTICMWYYPTDPTKYSPLIHLWNDWPMYSIIMFNGGGTGSAYSPYLNDRVYMPGYYVYFTSRIGWVLNSWLHTCLIISPTLYSLSLNGKILVSFDPTPYGNTYVFTGGTYDPDAIWIGRSHPFYFGQTVYMGYIDDVRIYNKTLSPEEANQLYSFTGDTYTAVLPVACASGSYSSSEGASTCSLCLPGTYSNTTASTGSFACIGCMVGTYSTVSGLGNFSQCLACAQGAYSSTPASSTCLLCALGTYSSASNSSACLSCPPGQYGTQIGATVCVLCDIGTYSNASSTAQTTTCQTCTAGKYASTVGASSCQACVAGTFSNASGASACANCTQCTVGASGGVTRASCLQGSTTNSANCSCAPGYFGTGISGAGGCTPCPANTNTTGSKVYGGSSLLDCKCKPGYVCNYTKTLYVTIHIKNMSVTSFATSFQASFLAAVAKAANVSTSKVLISSVVSSSGARRDGLSSSHQAVIVRFKVLDSAHLSTAALLAHMHPIVVLEAISWEHAHNVHVRRRLYNAP